MTNLSYLLFHDSELLLCIGAWILISAIILLFFRFLPFREISDPEPEHTLPFLRSSIPVHHYTKIDCALCLLITCLFAFCALHRLGSTVFPSTTWQPSSQDGIQEIVLELTDDTFFTAVYTISCEGDNNSLSSGYQLGTNGMRLLGSADGVFFEEFAVLENSSIFEYTITRGEWDYRFVKLVSVNSNDTLTEIGFYDEIADRFQPLAVSSDIYADSKYPASLIIDEQDKLTADPVYYDEAYFDEIYHVRNAAEIAYGQDMYSSVHPLMGTNIIALFIRLFGLTPFSWRLAGALFSIAIVPLMYAMVHLFTGSTFLSSAAALLTAGDFMHMTTGRIATLEPFSIFFILLMFYRMSQYACTSFYDTSFRRQMKYLLLCGIDMGIAISVKWTGCYSAVGLALVLFCNLFARYSEYRKAGQYLKDPYLKDNERKQAEKVRTLFPKCFTATILLCFLFFIFIPAAIYWCSFLPDRVWKGDTWSVANVWAHNVSMFSYHTTLNATHPFQSMWYEWLLDLRPIWYYYGTDSSHIVHTIACFSNPLLTWTGLAAVPYTAYRAFTHKDRMAWIIIAGYLTALGPWISFVERCVFAYHFYPASIFTALAVAYMFKDLRKIRNGKKMIITFLILYIVLFLLFLPVTAGYGTTSTYIHWMEWLKGWYFG